MKFILALVFVIPTYGLSLVVLFAYLIFSKGRIIKTIPEIIKALGDQGSACVQELDYGVMLGYAEEQSKKIQKGANNFEFTIEYKEDDCDLYKVSVTKEPNSGKAILDVKKYIFLINDEFTECYVPMRRYKFWTGAGIDDWMICEYYLRNLDVFLDDVSEFINAGGSWNEYIEITNHARARHREAGGTDADFAKNERAISEPYLLRCLAAKVAS